MFKKESFKDQVYKYLKTAIIKGELQTGVTYSEQQVADQLSVSRTPVREAVLRLTDEGMLEVFSNRGWGIRPVSDADLREILQARLAIERYSISYLVHHRAEPAAKAYIEKLEQCQTESESFSRDETHHYEYMEADTEFHCLLVESTGNRYLRRLSNQMRAKIEQATYNSLNISRRNAKACLEHQAILTAIIHSDEETALRAFMEHMRETAAALGTTLLDEQQS